MLVKMSWDSYSKIPIKFIFIPIYNEIKINVDQDCILLSTVYAQTAITDLERKVKNYG